MKRTKTTINLDILPEDLAILAETAGKELVTIYDDLMTEYLKINAMVKILHDGTSTGDPIDPEIIEWYTMIMLDSADDLKETLKKMKETLGIGAE